MKLGDRYEVIRAITSGGMGSIYEGRDLQSGDRVAIKQMLEHLMEGEQAALFRAKFDAEVEFLRSLNHPGIPRLYDSFVQDGVFYIVMEFVVGRNLDQELEERLQITGQPFPSDQIIRDARQVLDILAYLHSQDPPLVHRDIKPANLIREHPSGRIKLVDFGMARLLMDNQTQTQLGTLGYSPLEQLQGKAEQRSDLYALGATMHHLVTGVVPTVLNIPPVHQLRPDIDPAMAAIIDRACATEVKIRFANANAMLAALDELRPHLPVNPDSAIQLKPLPRLEERPTSELPPPPPPRPASEMPAPLPVQPVARASRLPPPPPLDDPLPEPPPKEPEPLPETPAPSPYLIQPQGPPDPPPPAPVRRRPAGLPPLAQQIGLVAALSALAFLIGWGLGNRPTPAASPSSTPTPATQKFSEATPLPEAPVTPSPVVVTPSPLPVAVVPPPPPPPAPPPPRPKPPPKPVDPPQELSLDGPSYPTANRSGSSQGSVGLLGSNSKVHINLGSDWSSIGGFQQSQAFHRSFRKSQGGTDFTFDIKGYAAEERPERYRKSFAADHRNWAPVTDFPGVDLAFLQTSSRYYKWEALLARPGSYYWYRFTAKGSLSPADFRQELDRAWADVSLID